VSHRNARLTVHGRLLIVRRYQAGWKQAHIAAAMGVSRKCVKTWIDRYQGEGKAGLETRSSPPRSTPSRTPVEVEAKVVAARAEHREASAHGNSTSAPKGGSAPLTSED
jgi:transposase